MVINYLEVVIFGIGCIVEKVIVCDGEIVVVLVLVFFFSFDYCMIDGVIV